MKTECSFCHGSGQISFFKGVSRFLLSVEECPECGGIGYIVRSNDKLKPKAPKSRKACKSRKKKS